jgi:hypothetical protein
MITLKRLRILIVIIWLSYICQVLAAHFFDPTLYSPILLISHMALERTININATFDMFLVIEAFFLIYSSAALWFAYYPGKWAFVIYIILALFDNYFISVRAFSFVDIFLEDLNFLLFGIILLSIFSSPLNEKLAANKRINLLRFFGIFFLFFGVFFLLPMGLTYFFKS